MKTGWISDRVGVGLDRIGWEAAAALRKGVDALGFGLDGPEEKVRRRRDDGLGNECGVGVSLELDDVVVGSWTRARRETTVLNIAVVRKPPLGHG